jgi:hypothetical protein
MSKLLKKPLPKLEISDKEMLAYAERAANQTTNEWFDNAIKSLEGRLAELKRYKTRFNEVTKEATSYSSPADVLSWAVNDLTQLQNGLRIDLTLKHAAELQFVANLKRKIAKESA